MNRQSIDGFVPSRRDAKPINPHAARPMLYVNVAPTHARQPVRSMPPQLTRQPSQTAQLPMPQRQSEPELPSSQPFNLNFPEHEEQPPKHKRRKLFGRHRPENDAQRLARRSQRRRRIKIATIVLAIILIGCGGYFGWKVLSNAGKVFKGNVFGAIASAISPDVPLKTDQYGNTNILAMGTSESDPNHPAAALTDSIMIISLNQKNHTAFLMSVPRDLWVSYEEPCSVGYSGKINAVYECTLGTAGGGLNKSGNDETTAEKAVSNKVSEVFGVDLQYTIHLNLAVVQKAVDAVSGIDITIDSPDPRGILDRNFDWRCRYKCYLVKYPNGPAHLDGEHAMWLVQARNDAGGYGLPRSNFDREANQRKVLLALKDKATSVGFLANPINVINLLDALGNNVHTTIDTSEIKSFINVTKSVPSNSITSIDIMSDAPGVLTTGPGPDGSSIVRPAAGLASFSDVHSFTQKLLQGHAPLIQEAATIDVINASGADGAATAEAANLKQAGFTIGSVSSAPSSYATGSAKYTLYDLSGGKKPATQAALKQNLNVKDTQNKLPKGLTSTAQFVVIIGGSSSSSNSTNTSSQ